MSNVKPLSLTLVKNAEHSVSSLLARLIEQSSHMPDFGICGTSATRSTADEDYEIVTTIAIRRR